MPARYGWEVDKPLDDIYLSYAQATVVKDEGEAYHHLELEALKDAARDRGIVRQVNSLFIIGVQLIQVQA